MAQVKQWAQDKSQPLVMRSVSLALLAAAVHRDSDFTAVQVELNDAVFIQNMLNCLASVEDFLNDPQRHVDDPHSTYVTECNIEKLRHLAEMASCSATLLAFFVSSSNLAQHQTLSFDGVLLYILKAMKSLLDAYIRTVFSSKASTQCLFCEALHGLSTSACTFLKVLFPCMTSISLSNVSDGCGMQKARQEKGLDIVRNCVTAIGMSPEISFCHLLMDTYTCLRFLELNTDLERDLLVLFTYLSSYRNIASVLFRPRAAEGKAKRSSQTDTRVGLLVQPHSLPEFFFPTSNARYKAK